jgi:hypothetical protein
LADCASDNQLLWVLILIHAWAPTAVLKELAPKLSRILDVLDDERWCDLIDTVRAVISSTPNGRKPLNGFDQTSWSAIQSPRLKAVLTLRRPRATSIRALIELLDGYKGTDKHLCNFLTSRSMNEALRETKVWKHLIGFLERHDPLPLPEDVDDLMAPGGFYYGNGDSTMSGSVVQDVIAAYDKLPLSILEVALRSLTQSPGAALDTLGGVAQSEGWFG